MMTDTMQLGDIPVIPDLSSFAGDEVTPFENGWYKATIQARREFTDKNGNDRIFESEDTPAQRSGRNIRLQVEVTRASDGRKLNVSWLINYNPDDLTQETVAAVMAKKDDGGEYGDLFRSYMTIKRLSSLQAVAGKALTRGSDGAFDLTPLYGKECFVRVADDDRNPIYKQIKDVRPVTSKPKQVL